LIQVQTRLSSLLLIKRTANYNCLYTYCGYCGNKIEENSKYCSNCGEEVYITSEFKGSKSELSGDGDKSNLIQVKNNSKLLKVVEFILWAGFILILLNLFLEEINWWSVISAEVIIFAAISYIKGWLKNFEIPLILMIMALISNLILLSLMDVLLYVVGIYSVILKKKA
jgi:hypothetical protein